MNVFLSASQNSLLRSCPLMEWCTESLREETSSCTVNPLALHDHMSHGKTHTHKDNTWCLRGPFNLNHYSRNRILSLLNTIGNSSRSEHIINIIFFKTSSFALNGAVLSDGCTLLSEADHTPVWCCRAAVIFIQPILGYHTVYKKKKKSGHSERWYNINWFVHM